MDENSRNQRSTNGATVLNRVVNTLKGSKTFHAAEGYKYGIQFNSSTSTVVGIIDETAKMSKWKNWIIRFDKAHKNVDYSHININKAFSGVKDPHIKLPPGGLTAVKGAATACKVVNKIALPLSVTFDVIQTGLALKNDYNKQTTRNTVEKLSSIAGGWTGGYAGSVGGAALGTAIFPGVGTIAVGIIGGILGGVKGCNYTTAFTNFVADIFNYDVDEVECEQCGEIFRIRIYQGETDVTLCPNCRN